MKNIYLSSQIKALDKLAAKFLKICSYQLMQKAGKSVYAYIQQFERILVVAGTGNNAGDGYVIANLARKAGKQADVWSLVDPENLPSDAKRAADEYVQNGGAIINKVEHHEYDCIVDAIFGIGLCREVLGDFAIAINWINRQNIKTIAVDVPSGLEADTGNILGCAVNADMTITIICYKIGLLTNNGKDQCGTLYCEDLEVNSDVYSQLNSDTSVLENTDFNFNKLSRKNNSHKGIFGSVVIAGGHDGMLGALILSGHAALRIGCGVVEVVSNNEQAVMISVHRPELMTASSINASRLLASTDIIAVGPGLGLNSQSEQVLIHCINQKKPMVIDADALTLIANKYEFDENVVLTPHPKEAATLLNTDVTSIQNDRVYAAKCISKKYNVVTILKGSGTIIADTNGHIYICPFGYSGMATAGMGDVLTGIVAGLMAQGLSGIEAAISATICHAKTAENCHKGNGLLASDVINQLYCEFK